MFEVIQLEYQKAVGTPAYMAPEQARAARSLTPAVDVFSLGGVLAFAATCEPPFGGGSGTDLLFRIVHEPPDLTHLRALDVELAAVIESCLAKDPADRPLAADLVEIAERHVAPGVPQWPTVIAQRIAVRAQFAATRYPAEPAQDEGVTEFETPDEESLEIAAAAELDVPPPEAAVADVPADVPVHLPAEKRDRRRRRLVLVLPVILATGTVGTLIAMNKVPFVTSSGNDLNPTVSVSGMHSTARAGASASARPTTSASAHPSTSASTSTTPSATSSTAIDPQTSTRHTSSGSSNGSGSSTKTTAASSSGPSGPGSDSTLVSGSEVSVNDCAGWLDFPSLLYFKGTVSAGSSAGCEEAFSFTSGFGSGPGTWSTNDITASNGNTANTNSCGSSCAFFGDYQLYAKICVWNPSESGDKVCSATYEYDNSTGKVTTYS